MGKNHIAQGADARSGIAFMRRRLHLLAQEKSAVIAALARCKLEDPQFRARLRLQLKELAAEIKTARERLSAYHFQCGKSN